MRDQGAAKARHGVLASPGPDFLGESRGEFRLFRDQVLLFEGVIAKIEEKGVVEKEPAITKC